MSVKSILRSMGALTVAAGAMLAGADIVIVNMDGPGEGFNDPTAAAPVGGNAGTTVGQQRLIAFQHAASIWGAKLNSAVTIQIQASFDPLSCTTTGAVLGAAGAISVFSNFPGREFANTWYPAALANKLAGADLNPGPAGSTGDDIIARFNSNLGTAGCLTASGWYYGLDTNHPANRINLVSVLLHEFGHGLGFANFVNEASGAQLAGLPDVYSQYTLDTSTGKRWTEMTSDAERATSARNGRKVVWSGINVTNASPQVLVPGTPSLKITAPASLAGSYDVGGAAFGPTLSAPGVTGQLVLGLDPADAAGPSVSDGCSALTNAAAVAGKIAVLDRGTCTFPVKVKNAQNAGAAAVLIVDTAATTPPTALGGSDPTITIPAVRITLADGTAIKAQLGAGVTGTLGVDPNLRRGSNALGQVMLYMPNPVESGSSGSHFDTSAFLNLLMEPAISADLTHSLEPPSDLTLAQMRDIGWFSDGDGVPDGIDACPNSDRGTTIKIQSCDTGVPNVTFQNGCRISDVLKVCASSATNSGAYNSCVAQVTNELRKNGVIDLNQHGAVQACAAKSTLP